MRRVKYYLAASLDGFIAHKDGSYGGFLVEGEHVADFIESYNQFDTVLMGRATYEEGLKAGVTDPYPMLKSYVFSRSMKASPDARVKLVSENAGGVVRKLKSETGKDIWLCGGGNFAATLFAENLIDEILLKLNPLLLGSGIPLFAGGIRQTALELISSKTYDSGVVVLQYRVRQ